MPTAHNAAKPGEIADIVLMPGDPLRAKFVAEAFLENPVLFNSVRGMLGYTGTYQGKRVSVMGSGMGIPSIGIYSYELFTQFDVESIIRVGSCGGYLETLNLFDVFLVKDAYSTSTYARYTSGFDGDITEADPELVERLRTSAQRQGIPVIQGRAHSSDVFYSTAKSEDGAPLWQSVHKDKGCDVVEMEAFGLFHNANITGKKAACLLTVSDTFHGHTETTPDERERSFTQMMQVALGIL